ncbi:hypothetical protein EYF80_040613 [Liparis tanakae]|uniref:Uncharacterized protein n=1 Tax=Liparis tanakae TaxID=230148 RepID=A0A4Z2G8Q9_9TELE|nr:hypothetical protein EYF80_040613 [Liparis tanakae]
MTRSRRVSGRGAALRCFGPLIRRKAAPLGRRAHSGSRIPPCSLDRSSPFLEYVDALRQWCQGYGPTVCLIRPAGDKGRTPPPPDNARRQ